MDNWKEVTIPEQKTFDGVAFPLVLNSTKTQSKYEIIENIASHKSDIEKKCLDHGAILFRGLPIDNAEDFDSFVSAFGYTPIPYLGGAAPRTNIVGGVFTSNEAPPHLTIVFHHELAQNPKYPSRLFFYCNVPPKEAGETPICLSHIVHERMQQQYPQLVAELARQGVIYTRNLPNGTNTTSSSGRGWQDTWQTTDKAEAERRGKDFGGTCQWLEGDVMKFTSAVLPAIHKDPRTGRTLWFNQVGAVHPEYGWVDNLNDPSKACTLADGTPLDVEAIKKSIEIMNEIAVAFKWQKGDILMIDNKCALHGRRSFTPPRQILAWLAQ